MSLKIRLSKTGKLHQDCYRIVVNETRSKRDGKCLQTIGFYNPNTKPSEFRIDMSLYQKWLSVGAKPTTSLQNLLKEQK